MSQELQAKVDKYTEENIQPLADAMVELAKERGAPAHAFYLACIKLAEFAVKTFGEGDRAKEIAYSLEMIASELVTQTVEESDDERARSAPNA